MIKSSSSISFVSYILPINSLFIKHAIAINPSNKFLQNTSKSLSYLAEKVAKCLKNTIKLSVEEFVYKIHTEFQLYVTDKGLPETCEQM